MNVQNTRESKISHLPLNTLQPTRLLPYFFYGQIVLDNMGEP